MDALDALATPGGVHEHTLLLVLGDHGMTDTGDHGGGTRDETDAFLLAYHPGAHVKAKTTRTGPEDTIRGGNNINMDGKRKHAKPTPTPTPTPNPNPNLPDTQFVTHTSHADVDPDPNPRGATRSDAHRPTEARMGRSPPVLLHPNIPNPPVVVPQLDLAATLSALVGSNPPFSSLGGVHEGLSRVGLARQRQTWSSEWIETRRRQARRSRRERIGSHPRSNAEAASGRDVGREQHHENENENENEDEEEEEEMMWMMMMEKEMEGRFQAWWSAALLRTTRQIRDYLVTYEQRGGKVTPGLREEIEKLIPWVVPAEQDDDDDDDDDDVHPDVSSFDCSSTADDHDRCLSPPHDLAARLTRVAHLARLQWAQFRLPYIGTGLLCFLVAAWLPCQVLPDALSCSLSSSPRSSPRPRISGRWTRWRRRCEPFVLAGLPVLLHGCSFFSNSFVLEEGPLTAVLVPILLALVWKERFFLLGRRDGNGNGSGSGNWSGMHASTTHHQQDQQDRQKKKKKKKKKKENLIEKHRHRNRERDHVDNDDIDDNDDNEENEDEDDDHHHPASAVVVDRGRKCTSPNVNPDPDLDPSPTSNPQPTNPLSPHLLLVLLLLLPGLALRLGDVHAASLWNPFANRRYVEKEGVLHTLHTHNRTFTFFSSP